MKETVQAMAIGADEATEISANRGAPIQSIERAFNVLYAVSRERDGMKLSDISREVGLHTSTTFHIVKSLVALGCLYQDEGAKRYRIGRSIFTLAASCYAEQDLIEIARPVVARLSDLTGESSHFAVWANSDAMIMVRTQGSGGFQLSEHIGTIRPPHATAIGKALLSGLSSARLDQWLSLRPLQKLTPQTITDPAMLRLQVERVRLEGVAYDDCEYNTEARCMAAPVRNFTNEIVGSLGISGPVWRMSLNEISKHADTVRQLAIELSSELGFTTNARA